MRDVFCSKAEMNAYLEIDQEIQNTEDFSVESNDQKIDDSTTENSSIIVKKMH